MNPVQSLAFPHRYMQGPDLLLRLPELLSPGGEEALVLASPSFAERVRSMCREGGPLSVTTFAGECTRQEVDRVAELARTRKARVLAGIGGGKTLDCAKAAADGLGIPVVIIPTTASTDAPCTAVTVLYNESHEVSGFLVTARHPSLVLADTRVILSAPVRFLAAGMADALATGYEAASCVASGAEAYSGGRITETGLALARLASETVLSWGEQAFRDAEAGRITEAVERIIEANILLSGVGFEATNLAAAHSIHNGLTRIPRTAPYLHGEKVAFGILTGLVLNRAPEEELRRVYRFLNALQLPVTLEQLGLPELTGQEWEDLLDTACGPHSLIHNEPMEITRQGVREAMEEADARGKAFLGSSAETRS